MRTDVLIGALIFAFTAVPLGLRLPSQQILHDVLSLELFPIDIAANVLGYVPLGLVLAKRGVSRTLLIAGLLSAFAETAQLFSIGRDPGVVDIAANLAGAGLGLYIGTRGRLVPDQISITQRNGAAAAAVAAAYMAFGTSFTAEALLRNVSGWIEAPAWVATSTHGASSGGRVEAHLPFDQVDGGVVSDRSENRVRGVLVNGPRVSAGMVGSAISLDGTQWIDLGNSKALRLKGSLTLSAWVRPLAFPIDDAAIISSLSENELGYQLDLTVDQGPRTIGFKIASEAGRLMARYGKTPLVAGTWYHVAGVYDADARTMNVYLNGRLDNGCQLGEVTASQKPSNQHVLVGRRAGSPGFEFIGSIDEAEIQSRPRAGPEIETEVGAVGPLGDASLASGAGEGDRGDTLRTCVSQPRPPRIAGPLVSLGMLIALGCIGLWRGRRPHFVVAALCLLAGFTANSWGASFETRWLPVLCVLFGGVVVLVARRSDER